MMIANIKEQFPCSKEKLWDIVTNNADYVWRSDLSKIDIVDDTHFIEYTKGGFPTYFTITVKEPYIEYRFNIENSNIKGEWIGIFQERENGITQIDFTEKIEVRNPIMKLFAKSYLTSQQKRYIKDLNKKLMKEGII